MTGQSKNSPPPTLPAIIECISSPGLPDGSAPLTSQIGERDLFGQVLAPVKGIAPPESSEARATHAIYGRIGEGSLQSAALQRSTESKLMQRLPLDGWTKSLMTWKRRITPSRRRYCQLAVSASRTSGIDCGLWQTPSMDSFRKRGQERSGELGNQEMIKAAFWPTPSAGMQQGGNSARPAGVKAILENNMVRPSGAAMQTLLVDLAVAVSLWATPSARDWKDSQGMTKRGGGRSRFDQLPRQIPMAHAERKRRRSGDSEGENAENVDASSEGSELEWIDCPDGKTRPVGTGIRLLAHGVSARVAKLRAGGNAIVPEVAAEFIGATM